MPGGPERCPTFEVNIRIKNKKTDHAFLLRDSFTAHLVHTITAYSMYLQLSSSFIPLSIHINISMFGVDICLATLQHMTFGLTQCDGDIRGGKLF